MMSRLMAFYSTGSYRVCGSGEPLELIESLMQSAATKVLCIGVNGSIHDSCKTDITLAGMRVPMSTDESRLRRWRYPCESACQLS